MARRPQQLRVNALCMKERPASEREAELALPALRLRKDASPQRAEREAGRIFAKAGLRTVCLECPVGPSHRTPANSLPENARRCCPSRHVSSPPGFLVRRITAGKLTLFRALGYRRYCQE